MKWGASIALSVQREKRFICLGFYRELYPDNVFRSLETCLRADITSDYQAFITDLAASTLQKSATAEKWAEKRLSPRLVVLPCPERIQN